MEGLDDPDDSDLGVHVPEEADTEASDQFLGSSIPEEQVQLCDEVEEIFQIQKYTSQRMRLRIP